MSTPVEQVVAFLKNAGFRRLPSPLVIRQSKFEFPAVMMGPDGASDIVLVADIENGEVAATVRQIQSVARALDLARWQNPLTSVLVGPRPDGNHLTKIMQVCRVLPVGTIPSATEEAKDHLSNWLAILTPLNQVAVDGVVADDPMADLRSRISNLSDSVKGICEHASGGAGAVEAAANALLEEHLKNAWEGEP